MNPSQPTQLDPQVVNLAKAIRSVETQGQKDPYTARGGSQEYGAYQFTPGTWDKASMKHLGRAVPLLKATKEEQNEVAYKQLKEFKDQGYNVGQIASLWNSGKPEAYKDPQYTGVNQHGVRYDVPQYAKSVAQAYQSIKGESGEPTVTPVTASTVGHETYGTPDTKVAPEPEKGFLGTNPNDSLMGKVLDNSVTRGIQKVFPGQKIGQAIGTLAGAGIAKAKGTYDNYDLKAPTPLQTIGDTAQGALMLASGGTAGGALARIGQGALLGAGFGASGALTEGEKDPWEVVKQTVIGGALGGTLGVGGEILQKAASTLPKWMARQFIGTPANKEAVEYAVKKGLASPKKMLQESEASIKTLGKQLDTILTSKKYADIKVSGPEILKEVLAKFPDSGLTKSGVIANLKKIAPLQAATINKLGKGKFTLKELHSLNSAIGKNTFKTAFDDPVVKAGKEIGSTFYHNVSTRLKTTAKETASIFDDLSKEYPLGEALNRLILRKEKSKAVNLYEILGLLGLHAVGGPITAGGALIAEKALRSPTVNLKTAGLIQGLAGARAQAVKQGLKGPVLKVGTDLIRDRASQ